MSEVEHGNVMDMYPKRDDILYESADGQWRVVAVSVAKSSRTNTKRYTSNTTRSFGSDSMKMSFGGAVFPKRPPFQMTCAPRSLRAPF
jgi:hypothetical protein